MSASDDLADRVTRSIIENPERWKTREYGKPYFCYDRCERDDGVEVMGDYEDKHIRIQGLGNWGDAVQVRGPAEDRLKKACRELHVARNNAMAAKMLAELK